MFICVPIAYCAAYIFNIYIYIFFLVNNLKNAMKKNERIIFSVLIKTSNIGNLEHIEKNF